MLVNRPKMQAATATGRPMTGRATIAPPPGRLLKAWSEGLPIALAARRLAGGGRNEPDAESLLKDRTNRLLREPGGPLRDRAEAISRLQDLANAWEDQAAATEALRARLLRLLCEGSLAALGFEVLAHGAQLLALVDRRLWTETPAVDWERSGLRHREAVFVDLRVVFLSDRA